MPPPDVAAVPPHMFPFSSRTTDSAPSFLAASAANAPVPEPTTTTFASLSHVTPSPAAAPLGAASPCSLDAHPASMPAVPSVTPESAAAFKKSRRSMPFSLIVPPFRLPEPHPASNVLAPSVGSQLA